MAARQVPIAKGEVLVAILNNQDDFVLARNHHWYRIPVSSVEKWLQGRWPPQYLAFYHTKAFGSLAFGVHFFRSRCQSAQSLSLAAFSR